MTRSFGLDLTTCSIGLGLGLAVMSSGLVNNTANELISSHLCTCDDDVKHLQCHCLTWTNWIYVGSLISSHGMSTIH